MKCLQGYAFRVHKERFRTLLSFEKESAIVLL